MLSSFCWSKSEPIFLPYSSPPETMAKHPPSVTGIAYSSEVSEHQALLFRVSNQILNYVVLSLLPNQAYTMVSFYISILFSSVS